MMTFELSEFYKDACSLSGCGDLPSAFAATTFYYDESGNAHRVVIKNGKEINLKIDDRFCSWRHFGQAGYINNRVADGFGQGGQR